MRNSGDFLLFLYAADARERLRGKYGLDESDVAALARAFDASGLRGADAAAVAALAAQNQLPAQSQPR